MSARVLAILERAGGACSRHEIAYQLRRLNATEQEADAIPDLLATGLVSNGRGDHYAITPNGATLLSTLAARTQPSPTPTPSPSPPPQPAPPPPSPAPPPVQEADEIILARDRSGAPIDVIRPEEYPPRRDRAGRPDAGNGFTRELVLDRMLLWDRLTGGPPTRAHWNPAQMRRLRAQAQARVDRSDALIALFERGDFPSETVVRKHGNFNDLLEASGFARRTSGRPAKDHPSHTLPATQGRMGLDDAFVRVETARRRGGRDEQVRALRDLAAAATAEADRLEAT